MIAPMTVEAFPDLTEPEAEAIERQLTRYGALNASERITGGQKIERLYSRNPIRPQKVRQALGFNVDLMETEGSSRLMETAAAATVRAREVMLEQGVQGTLDKLHLSVQEDSDDPKFAAAARYDSTPNDRAQDGYKQRNRRRRK